MITPAFDETSGANAWPDGGQLAAAARETIASFLIVTELLTAVGGMAVRHGIGQPLAGFQALLKTYQALLAAANALSLTARRILELIRADMTAG